MFYNTFVFKVIQKASDAIMGRLYIPIATGSHDIGNPLMGHVASSSVEHTNWPESARAPMLRITTQQSRVH